MLWLQQAVIYKNTGLLDFFLLEFFNNDTRHFYDVVPVLLQCRSLYNGRILKLLIRTPYKALSYCINITKRKYSLLQYSLPHLYFLNIYDCFGTKAAKKPKENTLYQAITWYLKRFYEYLNGSCSFSFIQETKAC